jgi:uncharacterized protein (TIGR00288 family)
MREYPTNVAIYWDFENIQASLVEKKGGFGAYGRTKYQHQEVLIDVDSVMEFAATFGVISINRAYCNWQWYGKYREALLQNGLELIQLFHPGASGKNGGDIKLCLDCTEDLLRFPHIDVVVIVGGDSDYLPLAQKIKALGKMLVGIGTQANTNRHWARGCHEFKFYEAIILDDEPVQHHEPNPVQQPATQNVPVNVQMVSAPDQVVKAQPEELLRRAIRRLSGKSGDPWVLKGSIRPMLKRLDPTFEEGQHGAKNFSAFIKKFEQILEVRAGKNDQEVRLKGGPEKAADRGQESSSDRPVQGRQGRSLPSEAVVQTSPVVTEIVADVAVSANVTESVINAADGVEIVDEAVEAKPERNPRNRRSGKAKSAPLATAASLPAANAAPTLEAKPQGDGAAKKPRSRGRSRKT